MPTKTLIGWTDYSTNLIKPVGGGWGCSKVSPGCDHCYAEAINMRWGNKYPFEGRWEFELNRAELASWSKIPSGSKVFVCDMTDLFHSNVGFEIIGEVFDAMIARPDLIFQILTKRPGRMWYWAKMLEDTCKARDYPWLWPPNVWAGTSVESQKYAPRLDLLSKIKAKVRFASFEPLLGPVDAHKWIARANCCQTEALTDEGRSALLQVVRSAAHMLGSLDWIIIGGESGPKARPMHHYWARDLIRQGVEGNVPVFFKQWGAYAPYDARQMSRYELVGDDGKFHDTNELSTLTLPETWAKMTKVGAKLAGNMIDGVRYEQFPEVK